MVSLSHLTRLVLGVGASLSLGCSVLNPAFTITETYGDTEANGTGDGTTSGATTEQTTDRTTGEAGTTAETTGEPATTGPNTSGTTDPAPVCGDGMVDPGEDCDDGDAVPDDGCEPDCTATPLPTCGNGMVDRGEECDDGNGDDHDDCRTNCLDAKCGDGFQHQGAEECDDGNGENGDACLNTCKAAKCGDGVLQQDVEACDDGNGDDGDACLSTCVSAKCGDGVLQNDVEECDDGDEDDTNACTNACLENTCNDGEFQFETEECDSSAAAFAGLPEGLCNNCKLKGLCFRRTNTVNVDFDEGAGEHQTWFAKCQSIFGLKVHVLIVNKSERLFYGAGNKTKVWNDAVLTSEAAASDQWQYGKHAPILMNGGVDKLFLYARTAKPKDGDPNCITRLADGYGLAIYTQNYQTPKYIFMPHRGGGTDTPRTFAGWAPDRELSLLDGNIPLCGPGDPLTPMLATRIAIMVTP